MKLKYFFSLLIVTAFLSSYISGYDGLKIGQIAPDIELNDIKISDNIKVKTPGKYQLINFWSPKNPDSRIKNMEYYRFFKNQDNREVEFLSICTDPDEKLMKETLLVDGVDSSFNLSFSQVSDRVFKDFDIDNFRKAVLINPEGKIVAFSPSLESLEKM